MSVLLHFKKNCHCVYLSLVLSCVTQIIIAMEEHRDVDQPLITIRYREPSRHSAHNGQVVAQTLLPVCIIGNKKSDPELMNFLGATRRSTESLYEVKAPPNVVLDRLKTKGYRIVSKNVERNKMYGGEEMVYIWTLTFPGTCLVTNL